MHVLVFLGKLVCYLDFEDNTEIGTSIKDKSEYGNNGFREKGLLLVNFKGCGNAAYLYCGDILFHGDTFQGKPSSGRSSTYSDSIALETKPEDNVDSTLN